MLSDLVSSGGKTGHLPELFKQPKEKKVKFEIDTTPTVVPPSNTTFTADTIGMSTYAKRRMANANASSSRTPRAMACVPPSYPWWPL